MSRQPGDLYLGRDGVWRKVIKLGPVLGVEIMHGYMPPPEKQPRWRNPLEMSPVVEDFLRWKFQPKPRPKPADLTTVQKDRLLRLAVLDKRHNAYPSTFWRDMRRDGATDAELRKALATEFQHSSTRNPHDHRRAKVYCQGRGRRGPLFIIGEPPDEFVLEGAGLLCAVRRTMNIKRIY